MLEFIEQFDAYPVDLTAWQVARILQKSEVTVRQYIRTQKLPAYKIGRSYRVSKHDLRAFILTASTLST